MTLLEDLRRHELRTIEKLFPKGSQTLEIGGGNGYQASVLASHGANIKSIDVMRPTGQQMLHPVTLYDGKRIPYEGSIFDIVFSSNVLEHVQDVDGMLKEIERVLKPEGIAIHILPTPSWRLWTSLSHYIYLVKRIVGLQRNIGEVRTPSIGQKLREKGPLITIRRILFAGPHGEYPSAFSELWFFSKKRWSNVFERNGFRIVDNFPSGLFYTGYSIAPNLSLAPRQKLSKILGSSTHIYVLRKI